MKSFLIVTLAFFIVSHSICYGSDSDEEPEWKLESWDIIEEPSNTNLNRKESVSSYESNHTDTEQTSPQISHRKKEKLTATAINLDILSQQSFDDNSDEESEKSSHSPINRKNLTSPKKLDVAQKIRNNILTPVSNRIFGNPWGPGELEALQNRQLTQAKNEC